MEIKVYNLVGFLVWLVTTAGLVYVLLTNLNVTTPFPIVILAGFGAGGAGIQLGALARRVCRFVE